MAPETHDRDTAGWFGLQPSMRPGQDGPGNGEIAAVIERLNRPSMRPGQDGPGNY